jgi:hypothetical protein
VTEDQPQRHRVIFRETIFRNPPTAELVVDVFVERNLTLLNKMQRAQSCDRLADRCSLKQSRRRNWCLIRLVAVSVALFPDNFAIVDHSDGNTWDVALLHLRYYHVVDVITVNDPAAGYEDGCNAKEGLQAQREQAERPLTRASSLPNLLLSNFTFVIFFSVSGSLQRLVRPW